MKLETGKQRMIAAALFAFMTLTAATSPALADHRDGGGKHRRADARQTDRAWYEPPVVRVRATWGQRDWGVRSAYYVEDPWNGDRYASLDDYRAQCLGHWPIARVIDVRSGGCIQTVCWHDGAWHAYDASDPPWAHRDHRGDRGGRRSDYGDRDG